MTRLALTLPFLLLLMPPPARANDFPRPARVEDVLGLADARLSDDTILTFLDTREIGFSLDVALIREMRGAGVSEPVIRYLIERTSQPPRASLVAPPAYAAPSSGYRSSYYAPSERVAIVVGSQWYDHHDYDHHHYGHVSHPSFHHVIDHLFIGHDDHHGYHDDHHGYDGGHHWDGGHGESHHGHGHP